MSKIVWRHLWTTPKVSNSKISRKTYWRHSYPWIVMIHFCFIEIVTKAFSSFFWRKLGSDGKKKNKFSVVGKRERKIGRGEERERERERGGWVRRQPNRMSNLCSRSCFRLGHVFVNQLRYIATTDWVSILSKNFS